MKTALEQARETLLAQRNPNGWWTGALSDSALATAVASTALELAGRTEAARRGRAWLCAHRNPDGGWGDSPDSPANFTATLLSRCALDEPLGPPVETARAVLEAYGPDRTFSVPILAMALLSGKLDNWTLLPQLPFELALAPPRVYTWLRMPVVSYALPVLIAAGILRHVKRPVPLGSFRTRLIPSALERLRHMQPESGGFLEAAPLTGFTAMCLIGAGFGDHPVARSCVRFLETTVRANGSWPIELNLSTWLTSLAARALHGDLAAAERSVLRRHLLATQWRERHPFTQADPGGWGWTDAAGGVPDADDTAAALCALHGLGCEQEPVERGLYWLLNLQNHDGGVPTFCRGRGRFPFDRSCPDITAHALRACALWRGSISGALAVKMDRFTRRGLRYLSAQQRADGAWIPLWFGSQAAADGANPVYGTVRVLEALRELNGRRYAPVERMEQRGLHWLRAARNPDGSWGHSLEETALAAGVTGLGADTLLSMTANGTQFPASPIGLYFSRLWYAERLYPVIFTVEALQRLS